MDIVFHSIYTGLKKYGKFILIVTTIKKKKQLELFLTKNNFRISFS